MTPNGPSPEPPYPLPGVQRLGFLKNFITRSTIEVGDYTYYDDPRGPEHFERQVLEPAADDQRELARSLGPLRRRINAAQLAPISAIVHTAAEDIDVVDGETGHGNSRALHAR